MIAHLTADSDQERWQCCWISVSYG